MKKNENQGKRFSFFISVRTMNTHEKIVNQKRAIKNFMKLCLREIQASKLFVEFLGRFVISACCLFGGLEIAKMFALMIYLNMSRPFLFRFVKAHTFKSACAICIFFPIVLVLRSSAWPQVSSAVINSIAVAMIYFFCPKKYPVHIKYLAPYCSHSIERLRWRRSPSAPIPLRKPFKILRINDGSLPLCERDKSVGLVKWLGNNVPFLRWTTVGHESSMKGFVLLNHFTISGGYFYA